MFDRPFDLFSFRLVISAQVTGAALNHGIPALLKLEQSFPGESRTSQLYGITCMCVCVCVHGFVLVTAISRVMYRRCCLFSLLNVCFVGELKV